MINLKCCKTKEDNNKLSIIVNFLKVLSEENRLKILCLLKEQNLCVCEIWQLLNLPQNLVSHHLKILKEADLVTSKKNGTRITYSLNQKKKKELLSLLSYFI